MAFDSMLRGASKPIIPLATRSVRSPRTIHGAISTVLCVKKRRLGHKISCQSIFPFSTIAAEKPSADENLIRTLQTNIQRAEEDKDVGDFPPNIPHGFPFEEIQDQQRTAWLKWKNRDETIIMEFTLPRNNTKLIYKREIEWGPAEWKKYHDGVDMDVYYCGLNVIIRKDSGQWLDIELFIFPDKLKLDSVNVGNLENPEDQECHGPDDLHKFPRNFRKAIHRFLWNKGIKPSFTNFLLEYMIKRAKGENLQWLKNLKNFLEK